VQDDDCGAMRQCVAVCCGAFFEGCRASWRERPFAQPNLNDSCGVVLQCVAGVLQWVALVNVEYGVSTLADYCGVMWQCVAVWCRCFSLWRRYFSVFCSVLQ